MPTRTQNNFTTISTEGALLPPDLLARIANGDPNLIGLRPADYWRDGDRLNEIINRAWNALQGSWANFRAAQARLPAGDSGTSLTRDRWLAHLFRELGYGDKPFQPTPVETIDGKTYPISHHVLDHVPVHLVSFRQELDRRAASNGQHLSQQSPHSLMQTYLNKKSDMLWGFLSNGYKLRLLRDNASLTRQAYVEFDLEAMMDGELYADFVLFWLLCHVSRVTAVGDDNTNPLDCWLERWTKVAQQQGTRALDDLRNGVEAAIEALGIGFLEHPQNTALRDRLQSGDLDKQDYFRQLLRIAYRLLFLFVAEDRDLLYDPATPESARARYHDYYSTQRLRHIAEKVKGTRHIDLWQSLRLVMALLSGDSDKDGATLGLPALGSFLFRDSAVPDVIGAQIDNYHLLDAVRALAFRQDKAVRALRPIDYRNLDSEEFGSIYESLLELHPQINVAAKTFALATAGGNERKTTGSYYTPTSLINALLDSALNPVIAEAVNKPTTDAAETALLDLKICDPACGSGHFLIGAAHRIAKALASTRTGEEEPAPDAIRHALRDVIGNCIYGVDINPMAVELCKVALWLNALEPGKPLSFLDHRIQVGNSLIGTTPRLMAEGIPDEAFNPIEGDDPKIATKIKKDNKQQLKQRQAGVLQLGFDMAPAADYHALSVEVNSLDDIDDTRLAGIQAKEERYRQLAADPEYQKARGLADAWCAAFMWDKSATNPLPPMTDGQYRRLEENPLDPKLADTRAYIASLRERYQFFHWHVAFPDVFEVPENWQLAESLQAGWNGGFDCVLGNPPWEMVNLMEKEFFSESNSPLASAIASARTGAERKVLIASMLKTNDSLRDEYLFAVRAADVDSSFPSQSGRYPLCGRGRVNTYALFAELSKDIIAAGGRLGLIVPTGIATDFTYRDFFTNVVYNAQLVSLFDFENKLGIFPDVAPVVKFCLLTLRGIPKSREIRPADFAFFLLEASELADRNRHFEMNSSDLFLVNPNTHSCPTFRYKRDAIINQQIYRKIPIMLNTETKENPWKISFAQGLFNMTSDSRLFQSGEQLESEGWMPHSVFFVKGSDVCLPLYEAKFVQQFDHRNGTFSGIIGEQIFNTKAATYSPSNIEKADPTYLVTPRYWVNQSEVLAATPNHWQHKWFIAFRDIIQPMTNSRCAIFTPIPFVAVGNNAPLIFTESGNSSKISLLIANLNSFVLDYLARQRIGGTHLNFYIVEQLAVLSPEHYTSNLLTFIFPHVLELAYTAWDLQPFAQDVGYDGPPFVWDEDRRFLLRCELDALYFHLYGIARDDVDYIMETFPIVKRKDEAAHGEYRTKRVILELYDEMAGTALIPQPLPPQREGESDESALEVPRLAGEGFRVRAFQTRLDPPPADPRVAHPARDIERGTDNGL
jgi:hypothetical protein